MQVFLIRHPRPVIEAGICYGRLDVDCDDPRTVADELRSRLPDGVPLFSSPLQRALKLARELSPAVRVDRRLSEIDFGAWEGRRWDDIARGEIDAWAADVLSFAPPGGESVAALQARVLDFAASLDHESVAIVTHAGVMRVLLGHWRQLPVAEWSKLHFGFGELVRLETGQGRK